MLLFIMLFGCGSTMMMYCFVFVFLADVIRQGQPTRTLKRNSLNIATSFYGIFSKSGICVT